MNKTLLAESDGSKITVGICCVAEVDEMQSFVGKKSNQRWLWHAIDHDSGEVLAYTLGTREDKVFLELKQLLSPFGITRFYKTNRSCRFYTDGLITLYASNFTNRDGNPCI